MDTSACVIGMSEAMRALRYDVELAARSSVNVLISGESGVGKQTLARRIHQRSARASRRLSVVDGARMRYPYELQVVLFHCSEGGTLLLESVSELAPAVQQELLASLTGRRSHDGPARRWQLADVRLIAWSSAS